MFSRCELVFGAVLFTLTVGVEPATVIQTPKSVGDVVWWKHAVFYQIYPRSFKDSNNDGIGDLQGIISNLEHLKDAGITATWLSPIYKSPQVDQGYDISDFMDIDESYGTLADFDQLLQKAHQLGIKLVMDFVPNHSSDQHEWFKLSEQKQPGYEDFYVWKDGKNSGPPNNWLSVFKFSAWQYSEIRQQYYLHQFTIQQPDLNFRSSALVQQMKDVLKFWLDRGVDGFRMDAAPFLVEDKNFEDEPLSGNPNVTEDDHGYLTHIYTYDQDETFDLIYDWRAFVDDYTKTHGGDARVMMTEAYTDIKNTMRYYGDGSREGAHFTFNFKLITDANKQSTAKDIVAAINDWVNHLPAKYVSNWVIGNHDQHRVASRFGPERVDGMNILVALLPGVMVTYNGEEIGQENGEVTWEEGQDPGACNGKPEDFDRKSRDFQRTPFQWDDTVNAGFNEGAKPWLPVSAKYKETNLAAQKAAGEDSHYHVYQGLLKLRQEPAFVSGSFAIAALSDNVLAFTRKVANKKSYVVVINIANTEENVGIHVFETLKRDLKVVLATNSDKQGSVIASNNIKLAAYECIVAEILPDPDWWKHAVFYQIYPRSFKDSNNDGIGDLNGIKSKLKHLKDAGVTAAWLSPIYKSPQVDQGYDISDFKDIHDEYGTLADFDELLREAHDLGIKIVMDFVPNHSSNQHEWFKWSEQQIRGYEDFYVWKDGKNGGPPNNWLSRFKYSAWEYSKVRKQYYLHQFAIGQPDLNYRNPTVVANMKDVLKFWLDRGVDGFRVDAVPFLYEDKQLRDEPPSGNSGFTEDEWESLKHIYTHDQDETYDMVYQWRSYLDEYTKAHGGDTRVMMTEAYTDINYTMLYYGNDTNAGAHFTFNFELITNLQKSYTASDVVAAVNRWLEHLPDKCVSNWVIGNHDNFRVATRFGKGNVDGFNMLTALLPGVMVTYNGEEIGQENGEVTWEEGQDPNACNGKPENFDKISRDFARTPFHWNSSVNAGFNEGAKPWLPVSSKYKENNLAAQSNPDAVSHYQIYKQLLKLRKVPTLVEGKLQIETISDNVLGFTRTLEGNSTYVFLFNLGDESATVDISTKFPGIGRIKVILASSNSTRKKDDVFEAKGLILEPHESIIGSNAVKLTVSFATLFATIFCVLARV